MKREYESLCGHAYVTVRDWRDGDAEILTVFTDAEHRGRGLMRELMREVLADADREEINLLLTVGAGRRKNGMGAGELYEWYNRLGFNGLAGNRMERPAMVPRG